MDAHTLRLAVSLLVWAAAVPAFAQPEATAAAGQEPPQPTTPQLPGDVVVVTASRRQEQLINAPATMTVITDDIIRAAAARNVPDLLRAVPGMNVVQTSARDFNVDSRAASGTLSDSMLVLLDGRSFYQDFFGSVMWDFLPIDVDEIKQIEVIRGPASAVWGANAMTGVVNVISKTPREMRGSSGSIRFGQFDRTRRGSRFDGGGIFTLHALHADAPNDRFAYKVSGGLMAQEPFLRPTGTVPQSDTLYPPYENRGTRQPRLDARADYDFADGQQKLVLAGGIAGTEGMIHTGLGPFDVKRGSTLKYGRLAYSRSKLRLQVFVNALDGEAPIVLQTTADGSALETTFESQAYDAEFSNENVMGTRHLVSYGGNYRHNAFDLSMAPRASSRDETGAYVQDQIFLTERVRWVVGARVDSFDNLDKAVFSPRTALIFKPTPRRAVRLSFNRAFRAPSFLNSYLEMDSHSEIDLPFTGVFRLPTTGKGNADLQEEELTAYEIGYISSLGPLTFSAAVYVNRTRDMILFTQVGTYTSGNPPEGWPLPPAVLDDTLHLPSEYSYINYGDITDRGVELSIEGPMTDGISGFANYTWQAKPVLDEGLDASEFNVPPAHHVNAGVNVDRPRYFGSLVASYRDRSFWQDVLDVRFHDWTEPYTVVNAAIGVRSADGNLAGVVRAMNLLNSARQQHIFGDLIKRSVTGELQVSF